MRQRTLSFRCMAGVIPCSGRIPLCGVVHVGPQVSQWGCSFLECLLDQSGTVTVREFEQYHQKARLALRHHGSQEAVAVAAVALLRRMARVDERQRNENESMVISETLPLVVAAMVAFPTTYSLQDMGVRLLGRLWQTQSDLQRIMVDAGVPKVARAARRAFSTDHNMRKFHELVQEDVGCGCVVC